MTPVPLTADEIEIDRIAKRLCDQLERIYPSPNEEAWADLDECSRGYFRDIVEIVREEMTTILSPETK